MNLRKLLSMKSAPSEGTPQRPSRADRQAVAQYERMLRDAPLDTIEQAHIAAFERLTPVQLGLLFDRFSAEVISENDRPADASPASLARSAAHAEAREPGTLRRLLGRSPAAGATATATGDLVSLWTYSTIFDTVATLAVAGLVWSGENFDLGGDIAGWDDWF